MWCMGKYNNTQTAFDDPVMIRYRGTYDYDTLMKIIRSFFKEYYFIVQEPKFKFKESGRGAEVDFRVKGYRKLTHYFKCELQIDGHAWDLKRKEGELHGKKIPVTSGKIEMKINAKWIADWAQIHNPDKFKNKTTKQLTKKMHSLLNKEYTGLQFAETYVTAIAFARNVVIELSDKIKEHLNMECY